jgi:hypothetical protein
MAENFDTCITGTKISFYERILIFAVFKHDADPAGDPSLVSYAILNIFFVKIPDPAGDASPVGKGCFQSFLSALFLTPLPAGDASPVG